MLDQFLNQLATTDPIEWLGMATGIAGVYLSIKEKALAWPFFIICYGSYTYIGYENGLSAFIGMNIVFIGISLYGWKKWSAQKAADAEIIRPTHTAHKDWPYVGLFVLCGTLLAGFLLSRLDQARLPYLDAFATCCGFTAQWMLSRKHIETWIFWILTDIVYLSIFLQGQSWPSVILFVVFIGLAIKGWKEWKHLIN